jgi:hypothetical protein
MKKHYFSLYALAAAALLFLSACLKNKCESKINLISYSAVYKPMAQVRNEVQIQSAKTINKRGKIYVYGNYIFLNEINSGIHVINNTNPANPVPVAFLKIPGNLDMAIRGRMLYADCHVDLICFDISNPASIRIANRLENQLPYKTYNYGLFEDSARGVIVDFVKRENLQVNECDVDLKNNGWENRGGIVWFTLQASSSFAPDKAANDGKAGSLARFALYNDYLYVVNRSSLLPFNINNVIAPTRLQELYIARGGDIETIYPFNNNLLIGSTTGMSIYGLTNPASPNYRSVFRHWTGCDPVVAAGNHAYVTVRGGNPCGNALSELTILDISNFDQPTIVKNYAMTSPYGLSINNGNQLIVCDGADGIKFFDVTDKNNIRSTKTISGVFAYDVIEHGNNLALFSCKDGFYQYDISNRTNPVFLSKLAIQ